MPSRKRKVPSKTSSKKKEEETSSVDSSKEEIDSKEELEQETPSETKEMTAPKAAAPSKATKKAVSSKAVVNKKTTVAKKNVPPKTSSQKKKEPPQSKKSKEKEVESEEKKKPRAPRKKVTLENHLEKYDELLALLDAEVERKQKEREKGTRVFRSIRKSVRELKSDAPKLANARRKAYTGEKRVSGLELKCEITDELADFMQVKRGTTPSRNDITNAICAYIHLRSDEHRPQVLEWAHLNPGGKRNLQNPQDRMKIIPDEKLGKLLGYEKYKSDVAEGKMKETVTNKKTRKRENVIVTDPSLKYYVVQRLIRDQIVGTFKLEKQNEELVG